MCTIFSHMSDTDMIAAQLLHAVVTPQIYESDTRCTTEYGEPQDKKTYVSTDAYAGIFYVPTDMLLLYREDPSTATPPRALSLYRSQTPAVLELCRYTHLTQPFILST